MIKYRVFTLWYDDYGEIANYIDLKKLLKSYKIIATLNSGVAEDGKRWVEFLVESYYSNV